MSDSKEDAVNEAERILERAQPKRISDIVERTDLTTEQRKRYGRIHEMMQLANYKVLEGQSGNVKAKIQMAALAMFSPQGLSYITYGFDRDLTRESLNLTLKTRIALLDDTNITEDEHKLIMRKAKEYGMSEHEVLVGLVIAKADIDGSKISGLYYPEKLT